MLVAFAIISLTSCNRSQEDAAFWEGERKTIELAQNLELLRYRYERLSSDDINQLAEYKECLRVSGPQLEELTVRHAVLSSEVSNLEGRIADLEATRIERLRAELPGRKIETMTLKNGRVFNDVLITAVGDGGVAIRHQSGTAKLRYDDLSNQQRELFGLEESSALEAENREKLQAAAYQSRIASELAILRENREIADAAASRNTTTRRQPPSLAQSTTTRRTSALSQPARAFGNRTWSSSRYRSSFYRSYRPSYRHVYYYNTNPNPYCTSRSYHSIGFSQRVDPRISNPSSNP